MKKSLINKINNREVTVGVIGLGYVGLPLATSFGATRKVIGFDTNEERISELKIGTDSTLEVSSKELKGSWIGYIYAK